MMALGGPRMDPEADAPRGPGFQVAAVGLSRVHRIADEPRRGQAQERIVISVARQPVPRRGTGSSSGCPATRPGGGSRTAGTGAAIEAANGTSVTAPKLAPRRDT